MAIRPVDMQVLVPRSSEVLKQDTAAGGRAGAEQQVFANVLQRRAELNSTRIQENEGAEQNGVDKDGRNGGGSGSHKRKNKQKGESKAKEPNPYGSAYDFSV